MKGVNLKTDDMTDRKIPNLFAPPCDAVIPDNDTLTVREKRSSE